VAEIPSLGGDLGREMEEGIYCQKKLPNFTSTSSTTLHSGLGRSALPIGKKCLAEMAINYRAKSINLRSLVPSGAVTTNASLKTPKSLSCTCVSDLLIGGKAPGKRIVICYPGEKRKKNNIVVCNLEMTQKREKIN
jgi:hypothetical protein